MTAILVGLGFQGVTASASPKDNRFPDPVAVSAQDIAWFRTSTVTWVAVETGAPAILAPGRTLETQSEIFEIPNSAEAKRFERVFLAFALYGTLPEGTYRLDPSRLQGPLPGGGTVPATVTLTAEDHALMRRAWWRMAFIDPKYPYGSYSDYQADMTEVLGRPVPVGSDGTFALPQAERQRLIGVHQQMMLNLAVFLTGTALSPGTYRLPVDGWEGFGHVRLVGPPSAGDLDAYMATWSRLMVRMEAFPDRTVEVVIAWIDANRKLAGLD